MDDQTKVTAAPRKRAGRCKQIKEKLKGTITFSLVFSIAIHLAMLIVGAVKLDKCPVEKNIPIFLVAAGVIGIVSKLLSMARHYVKLKYIKMSTILTVIYTAELLYFIYGSYWVYKEYKPSYEPSDGKIYCDKTAYVFAITYISFVYAILLLIVIGLTCFICTLMACEYACEKCMDNLLEEGEEETTAESRGTQTN